MSKKGLGPYSLGVVALLVLSTAITLPAFAEVASLQTNSESFFRGEYVTFSGTVEKGSQGIVTIVIHDAHGEFVMITQALIESDNTFENITTIGDKFSDHGIHKATGFILNMTQGASAKFGISLDGYPIDMAESDNFIEEITDFKEGIFNDESTSKVVFDEQHISSQKAITIDFVDPNKDVQYYIDRYYNEPAYKSWFERNYPGITIEQAVGQADKPETNTTVQSLIDKEVIPEAEASSINEPLQEPQNNSDIAQISLAVAGLGILFGAVYGIKRRVDDNSKQISLNRDIIRKKIIQPIIGSNPKVILQTRLAKGEITLEEYEKLKTKLG
ncbi:MAG: SHOCT domain-containing protein [Nitrosopumilus sp.]